MRKKRGLAGFIAAVAVVATVGCLKGTEPTTTITATDWTKVTFDTSLHIRLDSMVHTTANDYYKDISVGTGGAVTPGTTVTTSYVAMLASTGQHFDSSTAFQFQVGVGRVILGWDDMIPGMKIGGRRLLVVAPENAYGPQGIPGVIPPNAVLVFDVTVKSAP